MTETLAEPFIRRMQQKLVAKNAERDAEIAAKQAYLVKRSDALAQQHATVEAQIRARVNQERHKIIKTEEERSRKALAADLEAGTREIDHLKSIIKNRDEKLRESQADQARTLQKQRELDDQKREFELTGEKRVHTLAQEIKADAQQEAEVRLKTCNDADLGREGKTNPINDEFLC